MCPFVRPSLLLLSTMPYGMNGSGRLGVSLLSLYVGFSQSLIISCPFLFFKHKKRYRSLFFFFYLFVSLSLLSLSVLSLSLTFSHHSQPSLPSSSLLSLSLAPSIHLLSLPSLLPSFLSLLLCSCTPLSSFLPRLSITPCQLHIDFPP